MGSLSIWDNPCAPSLVVYDVIEVKISDKINVAKRPVPKRTSGEVIDIDVFIHSPIQLDVTVRLSSSEKSSFETIFGNSQKLDCVKLESDTGAWTFSNVWMREKRVDYEHSISADGTDRSWKVTIVFLAESFSFEA